MAQPITAHVSHETLVRAERIPERFDRSAGQIMHLPASVAADIQSHAARLDRTVGWCLWMAWCMASMELGERGLEQTGDAHLESAKEPVRVEMPLGTWRHLTRMAERLDRSKSWLLARAWVSARPRFDKALGFG